jgi:AAA domain-containing protein
VTWLDETREFFRQKYPTLPDPFDPAHAYQSGRGRGYAQAALDAEVERVSAAQNGTRNHSLNRAAFSLGQLVAGGEIDEHVVVTELTAAARAVGLDDRETRLTIHSGLTSGAQKPRQVPETPGSWAAPGQPGADGGQAAGAAGQEPADLDQKVREHLPPIDWHALWNLDDTEEWIIEPILPARRLVALYSPPKVGKSLLMLELAVAVARGETVLGVIPDRARRVLYVDFENDPRGDIKERLTAMGYGPQHLDDLVYLSFPVLAALDSEQGGQQLMAAVHTYRCEVVIIDTVSRAIKGEENENDTWLNFYRHTGKALKAEGIALIRLDHTGKDETRGQRGGSAKSGDVDAVWRMSKLSDTTFQLDCEANRMPVVEKTLVIHRETTPKLRHTVDAAGRAGAWRQKISAIIAALDAAGLPQETGRTKAKETLKAAGIKAGSNILEEAIRQRKATTTFYPAPAPGQGGQVLSGDLPPNGEGRSGAGDPP